MSDEHPPPPPELCAPIQMWRDARALLVSIWSIVGDPSDLAQSVAVSRKLHALYTSWLRVAEAVMRHLLMIEAAALPSPSPARRRQGGGKLRQQHADFLADQPQTWRVSFHSAASERRRPRRPTQTHASPAARLAAGLPLHARILPTRPLAQRLEAILRVFNNPIPYARRLARRLRAMPALVRALLRKPPEYIHRIDRAEAILDAAARAWPLHAAPDSS